MSNQKTEPSFHEFLSINSMPDKEVKILVDGPICKLIAQVLMSTIKGRK